MVGHKDQHRRQLMDVSTESLTTHRTLEFINTLEREQDIREAT
jgi:hypothetical protein